MKTPEEGRWRRLRRYAEIAGLAVSIAVLGGIVRWLNCCQGPYTWRDFIRRTTTSAFVGLLAALTMEHFGVAGPLKGAVSGACGYAGTDLLRMAAPLLERLAYKKLGLRKGDGYDREDDEISDEK